MDIHGNSVANTCNYLRVALAICSEPIGANRPVFGDHGESADRLFDSSFQLLTYQLLSVRYWLTEAVTGNGELGFDSGEGA
jgi:hypothetical protein